MQTPIARAQIDMNEIGCVGTVVNMRQQTGVVSTGSQNDFPRDGYGEPTTFDPLDTWSHTSISTGPRGREVSLSFNRNLLYSSNI